MATRRVTGAPAIQEPRAGAPGSPTVDLRALQVAIQNIRERFRLLELALNQLVVPEESGGSSSGGTRAGGPPGAVQFADLSGALAGVLGMTYDVLSGTFDVDGTITHDSRQVQEGIQWQDEGIDLGALATADTVNFVGSGVTATRVGNTIFITINADAGDRILTEGDEPLITEDDAYLVQE